MTFASPVEHVGFLARFLHVDFSVDPSIAREGRQGTDALDAFYRRPKYGEDGRAWERHKIVVSHPADAFEEAYSTTLHELGHAATITRNHEWQPRVLIEVALEERAWEWAQSHALYWTERMEEDRVVSLQSYYRHYGRQRVEMPGWYPPRAYAPLPWKTSLLEGGPCVFWTQVNAYLTEAYTSNDSAGVFWDTLRELRFPRSGGDAPRDRAGAARPVEVAGV